MTIKTRDAHFNEVLEMPDGKGCTVRKRVMNSYAIVSLGGATIANEWNYLHQKLMHGLGVSFGRGPDQGYVRNGAEPGRRRPERQVPA